MFRNNGYFAAGVGKIYHYGTPGDIGTSGLDDPPSWDHFVNPAGRDKTVLESDIINYTPKRGLGSAMSFLSDKKGKDEEHTDGKVALETIKLIEQRKDKPFFLAHGYHLGEHGLWMKQSLFEESARVPLVIIAPGVKGNGKVCARTVEFVDLYPTLAELTGLTPPKNLEGASLKPLLDDPSRVWERPAFTQVQRAGFPGYSVRIERWRYTEWDDGNKGAQLYDHDADPHEFVNLAEDPKHTKTVEEMKKLVKKNWPVRAERGQGPPKK